MADYNPQTACDFFLEFDNYFLWNRDQHTEVMVAYAKAFATDGIDGFYNQFTKRRKNNTYPDALVSYFKTRKGAIDTLAGLQLQIFDKYFAGEFANERRAFVDFGQGILYDERRALPEYNNGTQFYVIHTMDAAFDPSGYVPPIGYHRWYGFLRTFTLLNDVLDGRWLEIARSITIAWAIQSECKPIGTSADGKNPNNKPLDPADIEKITSQYEQLSFEGLDKFWDHKPFPNS